MLDVMTKPKLVAIIVTVLLALCGAGILVTTHASSGAVPAAGLRAADQFAADYTSPNGIDSDNRISDGTDTTPQVEATIMAAWHGGTRNAGFAVTGPAVDSGASPNVLVPTDQGPWRLQVVDYNGRWVVSKA